MSSRSVLLFGFLLQGATLLLDSQMSVAVAQTTLEVERNVQEAIKSGETKQLNQAWTASFAASSSDPAQTNTAWEVGLKLLEALDAKLEVICKTEFYKTTPKINLRAPGLHTAGASPDSIQDPVQRQEYILAIKKNDELLEQWNSYLSLMRVRERIATDLTSIPSTDAKHAIPPFTGEVKKAADHIAEEIRKRGMQPAP